MNGTWQTTGGGGGGVPKELIGLALVLAVMVGVAGAVETALAAVMVWFFIGVLVFAFAAFAGAVAYVLHRLRTGRPVLPRAAVPMYQVHQLAPEPQAAPRELPQHFHLHVERGTDLSALGLTFPSGSVFSPEEEEI